MAGDTENRIDKELDKLLKVIRPKFDSFIEHYGEPENIDLDDLSGAHGMRAVYMAFLSKKIDILGKIRTTQGLPVHPDKQGHYRYYQDEIRPCMENFIQEINLDEHIFYPDEMPVASYDSMRACVLKLVDVFLYSEYGKIYSKLGDSDGEQLIFDHEDEEELDEHFHSTYKPLRDLEHIVSSKYFQPDDWQRNLADIAPVAMCKSPDQLPGHARERLKEVFNSYVYGNWLACIATSRALLEYCMIDCKHILQVEVYEEGDTKKARRLHDIIESINPAEYPVEDMKKVQEYGNEAMHPVKSKKVKSIVFHKPQALDCIRSLSRVLGALYKTNKPFEKITG